MPFARPIEERFWSFVKKGASDECWPWTGYLDKGYGRIMGGPRSKTPIIASRFSYELHFGPIPKHDSYHGLCVCHKCDNRACVNPAHLFLGTAADNIIDRDLKGRGRVLKGQHVKTSKLKPKDVLLIRDMDGPQSAIALKFGISQSQVSRIKLKLEWQHI